MSMFASGTWLNEPPKWTRDGDQLSVVTGGKTDFWQNTFYDFIHDNGHFFHVQSTGDFTAAVSFEGAYETLYDQAGLMLRVDAQNWIKLGIEYSDGVCNFSLVCTIGGRSDWSVIPQQMLTGPQSVRITRVGDAAIAHFRQTNGAWQMMRLCPFVATPDIQVGPMTCSPQRAGFNVTFSGFEITPPISNPLHG